MVAKSDLQFAGEFLVEECQIVSTTGQVYDINPIVEEINIFWIKTSIFHHLV